MPVLARAAAYCVAVSLSAYLAAQDVAMPLGQVEEPVCPSSDAMPERQQPAEAGAQTQKEEVPVAKEVGAAAAGTAGQIGGAAVAGPIGAAVGGVIASKIGEAVGSLVKKDKKRKKPAQSGEQAAAQAAPIVIPGDPPIVCAPPPEQREGS